ncbi:hypothetical protein RF11_01567 [Thelohanellus kitauei]|uniref:Uncharacterized protein n=1 Tax=Thelohanellus kitauei TaxID=669202 RepID=A0A0C2MUN9_THEKT|nr:hypothetical protein RF11_01567 [Thelohanellus kitauei]
MADVKFWKLVFDHDELREMLIDKGLLTYAQKVNPMGVRCRNSRYQRPDAGFMDQTRKGKLITANSSRLEDEGVDISTLKCLRCKCCKTYLSPRTCGFLSYLERSRTSLSVEKTIQVIFY